MQVMMLAAGFGTRLLPLTERRPKCLMPVMNRPLLELWFGRLAAGETKRVVVNTHHLAPMVRAWLARNCPRDMEVAESFEPQILGTGGGLVAAQKHLDDEPFLLVNADVLCSADLGVLAETLAETRVPAVLGLVDEPRFNTVAVNAQGRVLGFKNDPTPPPGARWLTYSGLAMIAPRFLEYLPPHGYSTLVDGIRTALAHGQEIRGISLPGFWDDLGEPQRLLNLHQRLLNDPPAGLEDLKPQGPVVMDEGAYLDPGARAQGFVIMGRGSRLEAGAFVEDSILLPGAVVKAGAMVKDAVLGDDFVAAGKIIGGAHA